MSQNKSSLITTKSIAEDYGGFPNFQSGSRILIDGVEIKNCVIADIDRGFCFCIKLDDNGKRNRPLIHDDCELIKVHGSVRIII